MNRHERVRAALCEAGRPDLCVMLPAGRVGVWFQWRKLERVPTLDEVTVCARAMELAGIHGLTAVEWHRLIVAHFEEWPDELEPGWSDR